MDVYGYLSCLCGCIWSFVMTVISMWSVCIIRILYECEVRIDNYAEEIRCVFDDI